jgi:hypothetical protein
MPAYTKKDILDQLDAYAGKEYYQFPDLDHGYLYPVGARLSAYRDSDHWAILFDVLGYNPRSSQHGGISLNLHPFGNCLKRRRVPHEVDFLEPTSDGPEGPTFDWDGLQLLSKAAKSICVHGQDLPVEHNLATYRKNGIRLSERPHIESHELLRLLYPRFKEVFHAPEKTLRARLAVNLPLVLRLYGWQHPRIMAGELPSQSPSIVAIAAMLKSGRVFSFFDPGVDNVHWSNWPDGGSL